MEYVIFVNNHPKTDRNSGQKIRNIQQNGKLGIFFSSGATKTKGEYKPCEASNRETQIQVV